MKIRFAHDGNSNETIEINIPEYKEVRNTKDFILQNLEENCQDILDQVCLIYRNIILDEGNLMEYYRMSPDDEIWAGRLEYFLTEFIIFV